MTSAVATEAAPSDPDERVDWFLAELVRRANDGGLSIDVTLCVGGMLVSGRLVGGHEYFEGFAESVASAAADPDTAARARAFFRSPAAMYRTDEHGVREVEANPEPLAYIHLENTRLFTAAGAPIPGDHGYWRGKLSAVDGFVLGSMVPVSLRARRAQGTGDM